MLILTISLLTRNIRLILKLAIPTSALITVENEKRETALPARTAKRKTSNVLLAKSSVVIKLFSV